MPLYGNELSRETNPFEVNLGRVVKLEKGEFVGRAALQAVQQSGPTRKLIGLAMRDNAIPRAGYEVRADGQAVGSVTSGTLSPTLGTKIAMALVHAQLAGVGNEFEVVVRDRPYRAEQVKLPLYKRAARLSGVAPPRRRFRSPMSYPDDLRYSKEHEWVRAEESRATIGITIFAADELGDIVFVELPEVGATLSAVRQLRRGREREGRQRPVRPGLRRGRRSQRRAARRARSS